MDTNFDAEVKDFNDLLINEVSKHPVLYQKSLSGLTNTEKRLMAWTDIGEKLRSSGSACQTRWRSLRDRFVRECGKLQYDENADSSWEYFKKMVFLIEHIVPKKKSHNVRSVGLAFDEANVTNYKLIDEVKKRPELYDKNCSNYTNRDRRTAAWEEISASLKVTVEVCQTRWRSIRSRYVKECRFLEMNDLGDKEFEWDLYENLSFLKDNVEPGIRSSRLCYKTIAEDGHVEALDDLKMEFEDVSDSLLSNKSNDDEKLDYIDHNDDDEMTKEEVEEERPETKRVKCGEIVLLENVWCIKFSCEFCGREMKKFSTFLKHTLLHHMSMSKDNLAALIRASTDCKAEGNDDDDDYTLTNEEKCKDGVVKHEFETEDSTNIKPVDYFDESSLDEFSFTSSPGQSKDVHAVKSDDHDIEFVGVADSSEIDFKMKNAPTAAEILRSKLKSLRRKSKEKIDEVRPFKCAFCEETFRYPGEFRSHENKHIKPFVCEFCGMAFAENYNLRVHRQRHLGIKRYRCKICDKKFVTSPELRLHMRSHTGEKPFTCDDCGNTYRNAFTLNQHRRRHTNERPFICATCGKSFISNHSLRNHEVGHGNERPFLCEICDMTFTRRKALNEHKKLHSAVKQHVCKICNKAFAQNAGLYSHMKRHDRDKDEQEINDLIEVVDPNDFDDFVDVIVEES